MPEDNRWDLYTTKPGWEKVSRILDLETNKALRHLDALITSGYHLGKCAEQVFKEVLQVMDHEDNVHFGASDTEPRQVLANKINKHLEQTYRSKVRVDRWGSSYGENT